ncbi:MAG: cytochrome c, partial [Bacteroidota bacterium]
MKYLLIFSSLLLFACAPDQVSTNSIFNTNRLAIQTFTIDQAKDTILYGKDGTELHISGNTFIGEAPIQIELKEAIQLEDIVLANLHTITEDNEILSSNGMIHLAAKDANGKELQVEKNKSIKVIFPNAGMREGLKVFQGVNQDGGIRWRESGELENIAALDSLAIGQQLYDFHCSSCHSTDLKTDATGPALGNVHLFRKKDWFRDFTRNSQKMIAEKDSLAVCIWQQWKPTVMPRYDYLRDADDPEDRDYTPPILTDNQIDLIYDYLANESILRKIKVDEVNYITECVFDTISLVENVESFVVDTIDLGFSDAIPTVSNIFRTNRLAWANIDRFWNDPRTRSKKFFVRASSIDTIEYYSVSIVFRMQNVYIPSFWNENNLY